MTQPNAVEVVETQKWERDRWMHREWSLRVTPFSAEIVVRARVTQETTGDIPTTILDAASRTNGFPVRFRADVHVGGVEVYCGPARAQFAAAKADLEDLVPRLLQRCRENFAALVAPVR